MKVLYFDCFAGAAGDMILGALLDAGLPFDALQRALGSLAVDGYHVTADRVVKGGITAVKFRVHEPVPVGAVADAGNAAAHKHYHLRHIHAAIDRSALSEAGKARAVRLFTRLAEAEAHIHGSTLEKVHLHEVGALDSIIDIVGAVFALEWFAADRVIVSPMNVGGGMVRSAHGVFPVPAPATLRVLGQAPVYSSGLPFELLTPTGALVLTEYATGYGPVPAMMVERIGYGAGDRDLPETPNVLRVLVGTMADLAPAMRVAVVACEIDDMNPQIFGALMDRLYAGGALEVYYQPVQMKKNRPGTLMTVVCRPADRRALTDLVFAETTTIGVRHQEMERECLEREIVVVATPWGEVRIKVARQNGRVLNAQPEFDDVARLASEHSVPLKDVHAQAQRAWLDRRD
ncbi:MAG: nickel pincer cofactor biosynthesis protein LarC [Acidobacteria bacterium]|nr:nickel pincer cofactor biosynthesis protein LarC [Acidobacteriota bacterium]